MAKITLPSRSRVAVHKFSSCDGCQLAFLNAGNDLLTLAERVQFVHFAEAGISAPIDTNVDIAFVEGSISTAEDETRIAVIRAHSRYLVAIGACATSGGVQALRNLGRGHDWLAEVYPNPDQIDSLDAACPVSDYVRVDLELWGCPVSERQLFAAIAALLGHVAPKEHNDALCMACKARGSVCVLVTRDEPCMGPLTRTGCGALCPDFGRACYGCFGPSRNANHLSWGARMREFGVTPESIVRRFHMINSGAQDCLDAGDTWRGFCHNPKIDGPSKS
ncbi:MAG: sulfhydrogenase subunit delta [Gammaproteobacteria bacterium]|nr:sulfhydrogenase subunit delta [Gammaproteobacteria bacterium]MCP5137022.1 sulfhydrogenase subunit delta [Gammaproteobacteria bacterium]